jgi:hypothetical protein
MGDKSPKSIQKQSKQKHITAELAKKKQIEAAAAKAKSENKG